MTYPSLLPTDSALLKCLASKRFLITGGQGMLALSFGRLLKDLVPTASVDCPAKADLDIRYPQAFKPFGSTRYDYVIHCAALVDADYCEEHEEEGSNSILGGTINAIAFARQNGAVFLYPQSFLVYDGSELPIDEQTKPRPLGVYGRLKLAAEQVVTDSDTPSLVVRMGGFFGGGSADDNFVGRIVPHLAKLIGEGKRSIDIGNRVWQPTYTDDLAANCLLLLGAECRGIYCMASHGSASFHELAQEITRVLHIDDRMEIKPIEAALLAAREKARRPLRAVMQNKRLQMEGLDRQRPWQQSLAEYLDQPYFRKMFA